MLVLLQIVGVMALGLMILGGIALVFLGSVENSYHGMYEDSYDDGYGPDEYPKSPREWSRWENNNQ